MNRATKVLCLKIFTAACFVVCDPAKATEDKISIQILDQRDPKESSGSMGSINQFSCEFFVSRFSDRGLPQTRLDYLKEALEKTGNRGLNGKTVVVKHYVVNVNETTRYLNQMRRANWGVLASQGYNSSLSQTKVPQPNCTREETKEGWFALEEVSNSSPPLVADLVVEIDGRTITSHQVISPRNIFDKLPKAEKMNLRQQIMRMVEADLIQKIGQ